MESAQTAKTAARNSHIADGPCSLAASENRAGAEPGTVIIVGVGAVVLAILADLFTFLWVVVPVIEAVLLIGVNLTLLFFAAAGDCKRSDQCEGDLKGASSSHGSLRCLWNKTDERHKCTLNLYKVNNRIESG